MSVRPVVFYAAVCDRCAGNCHEVAGAEHVAWSDASSAYDMAAAEGAFTLNGLIVCPDCRGDYVDLVGRERFDALVDEDDDEIKALRAWVAARVADRDTVTHDLTVTHLGALGLPEMSLEECGTQDRIAACLVDRLGKLGPGDAVTFVASHRLPPGHPLAPRAAWCRDCHRTIDPQTIEHDTCPHCGGKPRYGHV